MNINGTAGTILVCPTYYFLAALISDIKGRNRGALANQGANCARPASVGTACDNNSPVFKLPSSVHSLSLFCDCLTAYRPVGGAGPHAV